MFHSYFSRVCLTFFSWKEESAKKSSFSWDFQCFVFVTYCFRYYFALSLLLLVPFFPRKTSFFADHVVFGAFCFVSCARIFVFAFRVGPRFTYAHLRIVWNVLLIVVLEGEMLPEFFAAVFREFLRLFFAEDRFGRKI